MLWVASQAASAADSPNACSPVIGRIVSLQGAVDLLRAGQTQWLRVKRLDTPVCQGDQIRAGPLSRAAMALSSDTFVRVDQNTTLALEQTADETLVKLLADESTPAKTKKNNCGAAYCITRHQRAFRIRTPFYSAVHEGTEFLVSSQCDRGELYVFEGRVALEDLADSAAPLRLRDGEATTVAPGEPRAVRALVKPPDAVQWTLYYPPLADPDAPDDAILGRDCAALQPAQRSACLIAQAETLLRLGRVDEARAHIDAVLASDAGNGDAQALNAVIAVVRNDKEQALALARAGAQSAPGAVRPWVALSYAQQASFQLEAALQSAQRAAELAPGSALVHARVAELLLSLGRIRDAERAAMKAVGLSGNQARTHLILGFVHLAQINTKAARTNFGNAIEMDPAEPLARLGLGLAIIRDGDLATGREQIEIAVTLDPVNALMRAYLGKAYHEENTPERDAFAATQFRLAQELDPQDPTPWFYHAIALQTLNRPGEAMQALQESIARNDNRAVYRSRFLLDQDQAARSASQARIYSDLGFDELAVTEARSALTNDPTSFGAHRFLAEAYAQLPRFEVARTSETLQSQLLQPVNAAPLAPQLQQIRSPILAGSGPISAAFQEFNPLFAQDRHALSVSGVAGSRGTLSDEIIYGYYRGQRSFQFGQYHYETDGFTTNADLRQDFYRAFYQEEVSPQTSLQAELRQSKSDAGDTHFQADPEQSSPFQRNRHEETALRLGARHSWSAGSTLLGSLIAQKGEINFAEANVAPQFGFRTDFATTSDVDAYAAELQYLNRASFGEVLAGGSVYNDRETVSDRATFTIFSPPSVIDFPPSSGETRLSGWKAYGYGYLGSPRSLRLTLGLSVNTVDYELAGAPRPRTTADPKFGLVVPLGTGTTLRFAAFSGVKSLRPLHVVPTLEPTQIAGFNQLFDDNIATRYRRVGAGLDQRWSRVFAGLELSQRSLDWPEIVSGSSGFAQFEERTEHVHRAYASWLVTPRIAASSEFLLEQAKRPPPGSLFASFRPAEIDSRSLPLTLTYHHPSGLFALGRLTFVRQEIVSRNSLGDAQSDIDHFDIFDFSLGMRLPHRWGIVSLDVKNVFDEKFRFRDTTFDPQLTNPNVPFYVPGRAVFLRLQLNL